VPKLLVRILSIPLYPLNLAFLVRKQCSELPSARMHLIPVTHFVPFIAALPCLMALSALEDQEE
jgi:hypothetical protein